MIDFQTAYILISGIMAGLFSSWIIRTQKQLIPLWKKMRIRENWISVLSTFIDMIIALIFILIILLFID